MNIWRAQDESDSFYEKVLNLVLPNGETLRAWINSMAWLDKESDEVLEQYFAEALGEADLIMNYVPLGNEFEYDPYELHAILNEAEIRSNRLK